MTRRPPSTPLFPYTTLFRSRDVADLQEVLASLATRAGQRLVTYLRLAEIKPPSRLPLGPTAPPAGRPSRRRRRAAARPRPRAEPAARGGCGDAGGSSREDGGAMPKGGR